MSWMRRLVARVRHHRHAEDLSEELRAHREMHERDLVSRGVPISDARDAARRAMGNDLQVREDARAAWVAPWLDHTLQDVRFTFRQMRRAPGLALTAVLLSGLGVGATTGVFSVVNAVLFVPLPYPEPDRILVLGTRQGGATDGQTFHAARARSTVFSAMSAQRQTGGWSLVVGSHGESVRGLRVSAEYFHALGIQPSLGRPFTQQEDAAGGRDVVIISDVLWRRAFAGRADALGQLVLLGGTPHEVVGVMPAAFRSTPAVDVWTPLRLSNRDNSVNYVVLGRLAPTATMAMATAELELAKSDLMAEQPAALHPRTQDLAWTPLPSRLGLAFAVPLLLLLLAVAATTAVACANLTGLLLFRALARQREVATRLALGGSGMRIVRQFLTESLLQATLGGAASLALAAWALPALTQLVPAAVLAGRSVQLDTRVLAVALGMTVAVGLVFGLAPALAARRVDLRAASGQGLGSQGAPRQRWMRRMLVSGEIAATAVLLVLGAMLGQSLVAMYRADLGFNPVGVTVARTSMSGAMFADTAKYRAFVDRVLTALRAHSDVESAAVANAVPIQRGLNLPVDPSTGHLVSLVRSVDWRYVSDTYFAALSMALRRGRAFDARDGNGGAPVAIVNETFARTYFGRDDVVSETLRMDKSVGDVPREIVGVVQNSRSGPGAGWTRGFNALGADMPPIVYVPVAQAPARALAISHQAFPVAWLVRSRSGARDIARTITDVVRGAEPAVAFVTIEPLSRAVEDDVQGPRLVTALVAALSAISLAIAAIGIFGMVAYATAVRRQETAIRLALGASRTALMRAFLGETVVLAVVGTALGLLLAFGLSRGAETVLGPLAALEPVSVAAAGVSLLLVVAAAGAWPALRAAGGDPLKTLRAE